MLRSLLIMPVAAFAASSAAAQTFSERMVTFIVPYPAGGSTDISARAMIPFLEKHLGTRFVVLNRAGAGGALGFREIAQSKPDGYTIGFINSPNVVTIPIERKAQYKLEDYATLGNIVDDPCAIAVRPDSPHKSFRDLVDFAKANPGAVSYGTTGVGSDDHFAGLAIERGFGVKLNHIPFNGGGPVRQALQGGHITVGIYNLGEMIKEINEGQVRALGVMSPERWPDAPGVPTFREQGFDLIISSERGLVAPAGISQVMRDRYTAAIEKTMTDRDFLVIAKRLALPLRFLNQNDYTKLLFDARRHYERRWTEDPWNK